MQYLYALVIFGEDRAPVLFVASETSEAPPLPGPAPPFLGLFAADGHRNLGSDERWADKEAFAAEALSVAEKELHVTVTAILLQREDRRSILHQPALEESRDGESRLVPLSRRYLRAPWRTRACAGKYAVGFRARLRPGRGRD
jgi:hypothetical protein